MITKVPTRYILLAVAVVAVLPSSRAALAQLPTGTILGVVTDATAAGTPGATVTARNEETGQTRTVVSDAGGSYRFSALPVGTYEVRVELAGFRTEVRRGLPLAVAQEAVLNFKLEIGALEQAVSVTAEVPLVNTTSGSLGGLVDERKLAELPLNGRNYLDLALLHPGVVQHRAVGTSAGLQGFWFSSNGAPPRSNAYLIDGASMVNLGGGSSSSIAGTSLGLEGIREYKIVTNTFSAEYGMTMGSQITIATKSGSNSFHGSGFEYVRDSAFDAANFFDAATAANNFERVPPFTRHNFGGSFGGPIRTDRTFFFLTYEQLVERLGLTIVDNVFPAGCHVDVDPDPAVFAVDRRACLGPTAAPSRLSVPSHVAPLLALFPSPNLPNNQFTYPFNQPTDVKYGQVRLDQVFSSADSAFFRYTIDDTSKDRGGAYPQYFDALASRGQFITASENHVFGPTVVNTVRFSYSGTRVDSQTPTSIQGAAYEFTPGARAGTVGVAGFTPFSPDCCNPSVLTQGLFTVSDDLFVTRGKHSFKFGTLINRIAAKVVFSPFLNGNVSFASLENFLSGVPQFYLAANPDSNFGRDVRYSTFGFYAQDDLAIHRRLTLNIGLRYEFNTTPREVNGVESAVRDVLHDTTGTVGPMFKNKSYLNFSPRIGFAWDVFGTGRTALRGGAGLFYDIGNIGSLLVQETVATPPFSGRSTVVNPGSFTVPFTFSARDRGTNLQTVDYNGGQPRLLSFNVTGEQQLPFDTALTVAYAGSRGYDIWRLIEANPRVPSAFIDGLPFWNGTEPRRNPAFSSIRLTTAIGRTWYNSLQVGLTKRLSRGLEFQTSYTLAKITDETQGQLPNDSTGSGGGTGAGTLGSNPFDTSYDRGPAAFDIRHNVKGSVVYRLPEMKAGPRVLAAVASGWWVGSIVTYQSGLPITPTLGTNRSRSAVDGGAANVDRPDWAPGRGPDNAVTGNINQWIDPTAFTVPAVGTLGNVGRNSLRGPSLFSVDMSFNKDTRAGFLGPAGLVQFRLEVFNILNTPLFSLPSGTVFSPLPTTCPQGGCPVGAANTATTVAPVPNVGRITSTAVTSRQIQLAVKFVF